MIASFKLTIKRRQHLCCAIYDYITFYTEINSPMKYTKHTPFKYINLSRSTYGTRIYNFRLDDIIMFNFLIVQIVFYFF